MDNLHHLDKHFDHLGLLDHLDHLNHLEHLDHLEQVILMVLAIQLVRVTEVVQVVHRILVVSLDFSGIAGGGLVPDLHPTLAGVLSPHEPFSFFFKFCIRLLFYCINICLYRTRPRKRLDGVREGMV